MIKNYEISLEREIKKHVYFDVFRCVRMEDEILSFVL